MGLEEWLSRTQKLMCKFAEGSSKPLWDLMSACWSLICGTNMISLLTCFLDVYTGILLFSLQGTRLSILQH